MVKPSVLRQAVGFVQAAFEMSERAACKALGFARSSQRYRTRRPEPKELVKELLAIAARRPRFGYRRLHVLLRRQGVQVNHKRLYRLYRSEGLAVRAKKRKRMASTQRTALTPATRPNERWRMDFVSDVPMNGRRFRVFAVVDDFTRRGVALVALRSFTGAKAGECLDRAIEACGRPETIVSDNGSEFTSPATDRWAVERGVAMHFITPRKPVENAYAASFNGKLRDEGLNTRWLVDMEDAEEEMRVWKTDYNEVRPHNSLGDLTPAEFERAWNENRTSRVA